MSDINNSKINEMIIDIRVKKLQVITQSNSGVDAFYILSKQQETPTSVTPNKQV